MSVTTTSIRSNARSASRAAQPDRGEEAETLADARRGPFRPSRLSPSRTRQIGAMLSLTVRAIDALAVIAATAIVGVEPALVVGGALMVIGLGLAGAYRFPPGEPLSRQILRIAAGGVLAVAAFFLMALTAGADAIAAWTLWTGVVFSALCGVHFTALMLVRHWRRQGLLTPTLVIVGATPYAERLITDALNSREVAVLGVFDDRRDRIGPDVLGVPVLGDTAALLTHRIMPYVDRVVVTVAPTARTRVAALVERLSVLPNPVSVLLGDGDESEGRHLSSMAGLRFADMSGAPSNEARALVKRLADLVIGGVGLIAVSPILALIALAVKLDSPGPVFFRQKRHGFNNEEILVWKFRSMRHEAADATASRQVSANDDRVTKVGRFIRRTSLDELPQLFNVMRGEMSLVGPRPHAVGMKTGDVESAKLVAHYAHRHRMKPGVTGWAAIHGSRGPVDTPEDVRRRVALDVEYIERQSFWLDLYIIAVTVPCLLGDRDAVR